MPDLTYIQRDFSGGMTDLEGPQNVRQVEIADNVVISNEGGLESRPGSDEYNTSFSTAIGDHGRCDDVHSIDNLTDPVVRAGSKLIGKKNATFEVLADFNQTGLDQTAYSVAHKWNGHTLLSLRDETNDKFTRPFKIIQKSATDIEVTSVGLPKIDITPFTSVTSDMQTLANNLKTELSNHFMNVGANWHQSRNSGGGVLTDSTSNGLLPAGSCPSVTSTAITYLESMIDAYNAHYISDSYHMYLNYSYEMYLNDRISKNYDGEKDIDYFVSKLNELLRKVQAHFYGGFKFKTDGTFRVMSLHTGEPTNMMAYSEIASSTELTKTMFHDASALYLDVYTVIRNHMTSTSTTFKIWEEDTPTNGVNLQNAVVNQHSSGITYTGPTTVSGTYTDFQYKIRIAHLAMTFYNHLADSISSSSTEGRVRHPNLEANAAIVNGITIPNMDDEASFATAVTGMFDTYETHILSATHTAAATTENVYYHLGPYKKEWESWGEFIYAVVHYYEYTDVEGRTFADISYPHFFTVDNYKFLYGGDLEYYSCVLSNIPVLTTTSTNYPSAVKKRIYRTERNGTRYFLVGEIDNATTTFTDTVNDDDLTSREELTVFTNGLITNEAPKCRSFIISKNTAIYLGVVDKDDDGNEIFYPNRVRQAVSDSPGLVPTDAYDETEDDVVLGGDTKAGPVVITKSAVYRVSTLYDGTNAFQLEKIASNIGGMSPNGGVNVEGVFFFAGLDQFYMTDGYTVTPLCQHLKDRYRDTVYGAPFTSSQSKLMRCAYDAKNKLVLWSCEVDATNKTPQAIWALDLSKPVTDQSSFTRWYAGRDYFQGFNGLYHDGTNLYRGAYTKHLMYHSDSLEVGRDREVVDSSTLGRLAPVAPTIRTCKVNGGVFDRLKFYSRCFFELSCQDTNDTAYTSLALKQINNGETNTAYHADLKDIHVELDAIRRTTVERRTFAAGSNQSGLRAYHKQVEITDAERTMLSTTNDGATVDVSGTTVALTGGTFPADCEGMTITVGAQTRTITTRTNATHVQVGVAFTGVSTGTGLSFTLTGVPPTNKLNLRGFGFNYNVLGTAFQPNHRDDV